MSWFGGLFGAAKPLLPTTAPTQPPPTGTNKPPNYTVVNVKPHELQATTKTAANAARNANYNSKLKEAMNAIKINESGAPPTQGGGRRSTKGKGRKTKSRKTKARKTKAKSRKNRK